MERTQIVWCSIAAAVIVIFGVAAAIAQPYLSIMTAYKAKGLCSAVFVSGRDAENADTVDLNFSPINLVKAKVNYEEKSVTSRFLWASAKAIYREGFGVTLIKDTTEETLRAAKFPDIRRNTPSDGIVAGIIPAETAAALDSITDALVIDRSYGGHPFSIVIMQDNALIAEKYSTEDGVSADTRLLSWSMAKSFTNAMAGILTADGTLDIYKPGLFEEWMNDERKNITVNDLLQMQSGLTWNEDYGGKSDVNLMLHLYGDMAGYTIEKPYEAPAGSKWYYSSGSTNVVSKALRNASGSDAQYYGLAYNRLFAAIGADTAVFETDATGLMVGSSYIYATTRNYADFGRLYLNDGMVGDRRILPEGWVEYSTTPASCSEGQYGSAFWLNRAGAYPDCPEDMYLAQGHDGQRIFIIPSANAVVAVLGYSPKSNAVDFNRLIADILNQLS